MLIGFQVGRVTHPRNSLGTMHTSVEKERLKTIVEDFLKTLVFLGNAFREEKE